MSSTDAVPLTELRTLPLNHLDHVDGTDDADINEDLNRRLQPTDKGATAWRLLGAVFVFEALFWGFPLSFGVFQNYYAQLPQFANNPYISVVGTVASGISYLGAPLITPVMKRFARYQRYMICFGWLLCISGLVAGSFATKLGALIFTQGIMYGVGFLIFYYPILSFVNEFWVEKRGMAYGILCASSGMSGVVVPFATEAMLNRYGYQTTLRAIAVGLAVLTGPLLPLLKGRAHQPVESSPEPTNWSFLTTKPLFWVYCTSNVIQGLGFFFPLLFLPSYATSIGLSSAQGALLLALLSVSQVLGQFSFGYLSDHRVPLNSLIMISTLLSAVATLTLWGLARSLPLLILFCLMYGFFGAGYVAMWARMGTAVSKDPTAAMAIFSLFCFGKGLGNVIAGPLSAALISSNTVIGSYGALKYKAVVIFTGSCMLGSAASIGAWYMRPKSMRVT